MGKKKTFFLLSFCCTIFLLFFVPFISMNIYRNQKKIEFFDDVIFKIKNLNIDESMFLNSKKIQGELIEKEISKFFTKNKKAFEKTELNNESFTHSFLFQTTSRYKILPENLIKMLLLIEKKNLLTTIKEIQISSSENELLTLDRLSFTNQEIKT